MTGDLCVASVYLDGMYLPALTVRDLDNYVRPEGIAGIEVYSDATVPAAYQRALSGCGVIIIWTK